MSLCASEIRLLVDGGADSAQLVLVAQAMECGDDRRWLMGLIDALESADATAEIIAAGLIAAAHDIAARKEVRRRPVDSHSTAKDSNRSRRNMTPDKWRYLRTRVFERDGFQCRYCASENDLTADHVVALVRGGTNDIDNLATSCRPCNSSKGDRLLSDWRGRPQ